MRCFWKVHVITTAEVFVLFYLYLRMCLWQCVHSHWNFCVFTSLYMLSRCFWKVELYDIHSNIRVCVFISILNWYLTCYFVYSIMIFCISHVTWYCMFNPCWSFVIMIVVLLPIIGITCSGGIVLAILVQMFCSTSAYLCFHKYCFSLFVVYVLFVVLAILFFFKSCLLTFYILQLIPCLSYLSWKWLFDCCMQSVFYISLFFSTFDVSLYCLFYFVFYVYFICII